MDINNNEDENLDNLNEGYLKEMETNNNLFEEKIKKLNNLLTINNNIISENRNDNKIYNNDDKNSNKDININYINDSDNEISPNDNHFTEDLMNNNFKNYKDIDLNNNNNNYMDYNKKNEDNKNIVVDNEVNYVVMKKPKKTNDYEYNNEKNNNKYNTVNDMISNNKNIILEKEITQLKNENNYKDYLIEDLKNQISNKKKKEEKNIIVNNNEYNNLIKELDNKNIYIEKLERDIKNLKFKIDNLIIENKKIKNENENLLSQREELKAESDINRQDLTNNKEKLNKLELMNKKLNKDYLNLSNDYKILKDEKEKLKSIIEEQNATIFNYEKQLNYKMNDRNIYNKNINTLNERINNFIINDDERYHRKKDHDLNYKYNYSNEKNKYNYSNEKSNYRNDKYNSSIKDFDYKNDYKYEKIPFKNTTRSQKNFYPDKYGYEKNNLDYNLDTDFKGRKYNYKIEERNNYDNNNLSKKTVEKNTRYKKGELNYLENYLSSLLKERAQLENDFAEIPEHPRTLRDIKLKNSIKDRITQNDKEIFNIQQQLKSLRSQ